jgi:hypothetical protein
MLHPLKKTIQMIINAFNFDIEHAEQQCSSSISIIELVFTVFCYIHDFYFPLDVFM